MAVEYALMREQDQTDSAPDHDQGDIFGKLPNERPGVRSPRRGAAKDARKRGSRPEGRSRPRATTPSAGPRKPPPRRVPPPREPAARQGGRPGVEDVAWAGITVAAEAATLGVRLLGRAVEAVRKPSEPR
jgi:hypothetical protein